MQPKTAFRAILCTAAMTVSLLANAQNSQETRKVTHEQLMKELAELEAAGYDPHRESSTYPADLQEAEERVSTKAKTMSKRVQGPRSR